MAGRPENPVDRTVPPLAQLAESLRALKQRGGVTYAEMAEIAKTGDTFADFPVSAATLKRAASGKVLPDANTVMVYVLTTTSDLTPFEVCDVINKVGNLCLHAERVVRAPYHLYRAPDPRFVSTVADLSRALRDLHVWVGSPPVRAMEERAGEHSVLPHSTAHRILQGRTVPVDEAQLRGFLRACRVDVEEDELWLGAWRRAEKTYRGIRQRPAHRGMHF